MVKLTVTIKWLAHASFQIKTKSKSIYIDLEKGADPKEDADIVLATHSHFDHCDPDKINQVRSDKTVVIAPADCQSKVTKFNIPVKMEIVEAGQDLVFGNVKISTLPAYNIDKHFHPKDELWVGYLIKMNDVFIYHAGDTELIPEMKKFGHIDIAMLPIGNKFTMSIEEAMKVAKIINPRIVIPMHNHENNPNDLKELIEKHTNITCIALEMGDTFQFN